MDTIMVDEPLFRPLKRRKFMRKRQHDEDEDKNESSASPQAEGLSSPPEQPEQDGGSDLAVNRDISVAEILRLRKLNKHRKAGIEFSNTKTEDESASTTTLAVQTPEEQRLNGISDRFVHHTGQIVDVNKHMMAYIEAEMAKRRQDDRAPSSGTTSSHQISSNSASAPDKVPQRQPASLGKLQEIDLGPDAAARNAERTEAAIRRQKGEIVAEEEEEEEEVPQKKPRLGKDGKPWRRRRRRNSEDVKRDKLVEEVLRESKLEIYDEPQLEDGNDDQEADDRIAEQFRRDFMDAIQSRHRNNRQSKPSGPGSKVEPPKGPKLGGSRSARAAMREQQEKTAKK